MISDSFSERSVKNSERTLAPIKEISKYLSDKQTHKNENGAEKSIEDIRIFCQKENAPSVLMLLKIKTLLEINVFFFLLIFEKPKHRVIWGLPNYKIILKKARQDWRPRSLF